MKRKLTIISIVISTTISYGQTWLDLGYRISFQNSEKLKSNNTRVNYWYNNTSFYRGFDIHLSWCDCSRLTLGFQTRKVEELFSFEAKSVFPTVDFKEYYIKDYSLLTGRYKKRDFRIPLDYYRRFKLTENLTFQINAGMYLNIMDDFGSMSNKYIENKDQNQKIFYTYDRNKNQGNSLKITQFGGTGGISLEQYLISIGYVYLQVSTQQNFLKPTQEKHDLELKQISYNDNGDIIDTKLYGSKFTVIKNAPNVFLEIGFKTYGFKFNNKGRLNRTKLNGAWPF